MTQMRTVANLRDDARMMIDLVRFTGRTMDTDVPVPFGAAVVETATGQRLVRTVNAVARENDPTAHAETRVVRLACKKRKSFQLRGYTLYTTCEPCPMCMGAILWSGLDRVVFGATIADAARHCNQIYVPCGELVERGDLKCEVAGPIEQQLCNTLFNHPKMLQQFAAWKSNRR